MPTRPPSYPAYRLVVHKTSTLHDKSRIGRHVKRYMDEIGKYASASARVKETRARQGGGFDAEGRRRPGQQAGPSAAGEPDPGATYIQRADDGFGKHGSLLATGALQPPTPGFPAVSPGWGKPNQDEHWKRVVTGRYTALLEGPACKANPKVRHLGTRWVISLAEQGLRDLNDAGVPADLFFEELLRRWLPRLREMQELDPDDEVNLIAGLHHDTRKLHLHLLILPVSKKGVPIKAYDQFAQARGAGKRNRPQKTYQADMTGTANQVAEQIVREWLPYRLQSAARRLDLLTERLAQETALPIERRPAPPLPLEFYRRANQTAWRKRHDGVDLRAGEAEQLAGLEREARELETRHPETVALLERGDFRLLPVERYRMLVALKARAELSAAVEAEGADPARVRARMPAAAELFRHRPASPGPLSGPAALRAARDLYTAQMGLETQASRRRLAAHPPEHPPRPDEAREEAGFWAGLYAFWASALAQHLRDAEAAAREGQTRKLEAKLQQAHERYRQARHGILQCQRAEQQAQQERRLCRDDLRALRADLRAIKTKPGPGAFAAFEMRLDALAAAPTTRALAQTARAAYHQEARRLAQRYQGAWHPEGPPAQRLLAHATLERLRALEPPGPTPEQTLQRALRLGHEAQAEALTLEIHALKAALHGAQSGRPALHPPTAAERAALHQIEADTGVALSGFELIPALPEHFSPLICGGFLRLKAMPQAPSPPLTGPGAAALPPLPPERAALTAPAPAPPAAPEPAPPPALAAASEPAPPAAAPRGSLADRLKNLQKLYGGRGPDLNP